MASILCLAHYCDTHGPTPLMVTEGLSVGCTSCADDEPSTRRSSTSSRPLNPPDSLAGVPTSRNRSAASSDKENGSQHSAPTPKLMTPPGSPRVVALQSRRNVNNQRDSSFRKTYDENDKKRAIPCENCALTLPKKTNEGSDGQGGLIHNSGPILRTRKPYERVAAPMRLPEHSPPKSDSSEADEPEAAEAPQLEHGTESPRAGTSSSNSSFSSSLSHAHYLDYTSTHEPLAPTSFSIIRQSCLRTLSCETLPPSSAQPPSPSTYPFTTGPPPTTSSGGPIFFGDALAGYTTAYIFRIPDPTARGRRRVYALMALSTHRERLAMQCFPLLAAAFRDLAAWILALAEAEADCDRPAPVAAPPAATSSFLGGARSADGKPRVNLRARGLAELVGLPDFFLELHAHFVRLLVEIGILLGS